MWKCCMCFWQCTGAIQPVVSRVIIRGKTAGEMSVSDTKLIRSRSLAISRNNTGNVENEHGVAQKKGLSGQKLLRNNSLSTWPVFLKRSQNRVEYKQSAAIWRLCLRRLYNLHRRITKFVRVRMVSCLSSDRLRTGGGAVRRNVICLNTSARTPRVPSAAQRYWTWWGVSRSSYSLLKTGRWNGWDEINARTGLRGILEEKNNRSLKKCFDLWWRSLIEAQKPGRRHLWRGSIRVVAVNRW